MPPNSAGVARLVAFPLLAAVLSGCAMKSGAPAPRSQQKEIVVFAAASLKESFAEIANQFEAKDPNDKVSLSFGGSQQLALQINAEAPCDAFASANMDQVKVAEASNRIESAQVKELAENKLVVVASKASNIGKLQDIAKKGVKVVLGAEQVPVGKYSQQALGKISPAFKQSVLENVVSFEQDVRAVLTKVELGEADAGIVYQTDAIQAGKQMHVIDIPPGANIAAKYYIAPIKGSDPGAAFVSYVLSADGRKALATHGFAPPTR